MARRRERPLLAEEREAIERLHKAGMNPTAIATALFITRRQVLFSLAHPDNNPGEAVTA